MNESNSPENPHLTKPNLDQVPEVSNGLSQEIKIQVTEAACLQARLLLENDYRLPGPYLRIQISGKGCAGFTYAVVFDHSQPGDFTYCVSPQLTLLLDEFTFLYSRQITLDYQRLDSGEEGFMIENHAGELLSGKFYKNPQLTPEYLRREKND